MRTLRLVVDVPAPADVAYERLCDFASYPRYSPAVRDVAVTDVTGTSSVSRWEVLFRNGILRWSEQDTFDRAARHIAFEQLDGDIELFRGGWHCAPHGTGCRVTFTAELDLGMPTLADALEPIAVRALTDNTLSILSGLFDGVVPVLQDVPQIPGQSSAPQPAAAPRERG